MNPQNKGQKKSTKERTMYDDSKTKSDIMEDINHELYLMHRDIEGMLEHLREIDELLVKLKKRK